MLERRKIEGWDVLAEASVGNAAELLAAVLVAREGGGIIASRITGAVQKIEIAGKICILKNISGHKHRFAYLFQNVVRGSYAFRLMKAVHRASEKNRAERRCSEIYLAANRMRFGVPVESCLLMEFIDGSEVGDIPDGVSRYAVECAQAVAWLHENGIVHGDVHAHNFIVEKRTGKVFAIDVSGKVPTALQKARDRMKVEDVFGVRNAIVDFAWCVTVFKAWRKKILRRLKAAFFGKR